MTAEEQVTAEQAAKEQAAEENNELGNMLPTMAIASMEHSPAGPAPPTYVTHSTGNSVKDNYAAYCGKDGGGNPAAAQKHVSLSPLPHSWKINRSAPVGNMGGLPYGD